MTVRESSSRRAHSRHGWRDLDRGGYAGVRGWPQVWRFRRPRKWIFIGSSQFLHLVSMRVVLDCGVVGPSGGYRMSGPRKGGPVFV